jgi:hypothetical protein
MIEKTGILERKATTGKTYTATMEIVCRIPVDLCFEE